MADLAAHTIHETRPRAGRDSYPITDGVTAYAGMLVGIQGGHANHWADGATDVFAGLAIGGDDRAGDGVLTGETSDSPDPQLHVNTGGDTLMHLASVGEIPSGTVTQSDVGDVVYATSSNVTDITISSSGRSHPIGYIIRFRSATDVDVQLFTPTEMLAQATA